METGRRSVGCSLSANGVGRHGDPVRPSRTEYRVEAVPESIFSDGFEAGDVSAWQPADP